MVSICREIGAGNKVAVTHIVPIRSLAPVGCDNLVVTVRCCLGLRSCPSALAGRQNHLAGGLSPEILI